MITSRPFIPGMTRSSNTRSGWIFFIRVTALVPLFAVCVINPSGSNADTRNAAFIALSSTIIIIFKGPIFSGTIQRCKNWETPF